MKRRAPVGAAILSFVVPGLGHFFVGETSRGAVFLVAFLVSVPIVLSVPIGTMLIFGTIASIDAYRGATERNAGGVARPVGAGLWVPLLVLVVALATAAIIVSEIDANDKERQEQDAITRCLETTPRPDPCFQLQDPEDVRRCLEKARPDRCLQ